MDVGSLDSDEIKQMSFMSSLAANPSGSVYGQPKQQNDNDVLGIVNQMKDREMQDFKDKSTFMADLSNKQDRMRRLFDPETQGYDSLGNVVGKASSPSQNGSMNTVMAKDPDAMTGYEKGQLNIRQQDVNTDKQRLAQQGKLGQEAIDVRGRQESLNQQKSDQIHQQKLADMERKTNEADAKIQMAQQALDSKNNNAEQALQAHKDLAAAMEERHKLELAQKDAQFQKTSEQHQQTIDELKKRVEDAKNTKQVKYDTQGNKITTETTKGDATEMVDVVGPNGVKGKIPKNKLDDWNKNHQPQEQEQ